MQNDVLFKLDTVLDECPLFEQLLEDIYLTFDSFVTSERFSLHGNLLQEQEVHC